MKHIGHVIQTYRDKINMSRKTLAKNICSEKYVYLIENGARNPSANIARLLGDKLGIDLFKYYEYLDCVNPVDVESAITCFNKYRQESDLTALQKVTDEATLLTDFRKPPWIYEIELNRLVFMALYQGKPRETIERVQDVFYKIEPKYSEGICAANFYVLLSTCYQMTREIDNAKSAVLAAHSIIYGKERIAKYAQAIISTKINQITLHYLGNELNEVIEQGIRLNQYQIEMNAYERIHHGFFYLAFAYYQKGQEDEGAAWFVKGLHASLIRYKPMDIHYLSSYATFMVLINDPRVPRGLVKEFREQYAIN